MKSCIVPSARHRCIFVRSVGSISKPVWIELFEQIMSLELFAQAVPIFVDKRAVDFTAESSVLLDIGRAPVLPGLPGTPRKVAMVVSNELAFAQIGIVTRLRSRPDHNPSAFRSMREAADWIDRPAMTNGFPHEIDALMDRTLARLQNGQIEIAWLPDETS